MTLTDRELATILHGLRIVQERETGVLGGVEGLDSCGARGAHCDHFTNAPMLNEDEIDQLCERLNCTDDSEIYTHDPQRKARTR